MAQLKSRQVKHNSISVHPADLDDALCSSFLEVHQQAKGATQVPFAIDEVLLQDTYTCGHLWAVRSLARKTIIPI